MKSFIKEFKEFISKGNVMDMAVGVIIGGAFTAIVTSLVDDAIDIPEFYFLESIPAEDFWPRNAMLDSTPHRVYDAGLIKNANLPRFLNKAGEPYSAIYVGRDERLSCERAHEQGMIDYWNQG